MGFSLLPTYHMTLALKSPSPGIKRVRFAPIVVIKIFYNVLLCSGETLELNTWSFSTTAPLALARWKKEHPKSACNITRTITVAEPIGPSPALPFLSRVGYRFSA